MWLRNSLLAVVLLIAFHTAKCDGDGYDRWSVLDGIGSSSQVTTDPPAATETPSPSPSVAPVQPPESPSPPPSDWQSKAGQVSYKSTASRKSSCEAVACFTDSSCKNAGCGTHECKKCPTCTGTEASGLCVKKGADRSCPAITCTPEAPSFVDIPSPYPPPSPESFPPPAPSPSPSPSPSPPTKAEPLTLPSPAPLPSPEPSPSPSPSPSLEAEPVVVLPSPSSSPPGRVFEIAPPSAPPAAVPEAGLPNVIQLPWGAVTVQGQNGHVIQGGQGDGSHTYIPVVFAVPSSQADQQGHTQFLGPSSHSGPTIQGPPPVPTPAPNPAPAPAPAPAEPGPAAFPRPLDGFQLFNGQFLQQLGLTGNG